MSMPVMSESLQKKVALHLQMQYDIFVGRRPRDRAGAEGLFDDAEVQNWLDTVAKENLAPNTSYTG